ncbi:transketolase C-terminal domain-containing protein [Undibacterium arcticum]
MHTSWPMLRTVKPELILIASGSEVALIVAAQQQLLTQNIQARIVSMPSWEMFDGQSQEYRGMVLPPAIGARLAVEAGVAQGWHRYVGDRGDVIAVDHFGASAAGEVVMREYGFTVENVCRRAVALLHIALVARESIRWNLRLGKPLGLFNRRYPRDDIATGNLVLNSFNLCQQVQQFL